MGPGGWGLLCPDNRGVCLIEDRRLMCVDCCLSLPVCSLWFGMEVSSAKSRSAYLFCPHLIPKRGPSIAFFIQHSIQLVPNVHYERTQLPAANGVVWCHETNDRQPVCCVSCPIIMVYQLVQYPRPKYQCNCSIFRINVGVVKCNWTCYPGVTVVCTQGLHPRAQPTFTP